MGNMFSIIPILFVAAFVLFLVIFCIIIFSSLSKSRRNTNMPELTVQATVVSKRLHVWGDHSTTRYYVTFQVDSGDRMELEVPDDRYGYLVENDCGLLTFRGTQFLSFART